MTADNGKTMTKRMESENKRERDASEPSDPLENSRNWRRLFGWLAIGTALVACAAIGRQAWLTPNRYRLDKVSPSLTEMAEAARPEVAELIREAIELVEGLAQKYPDTAEVLDVMAWLHNRFGSKERAAECWHKCLELDPGFEGACAQLGLIARESGESQRAAEYLRKAAELNPDSEGLPVELAQALMDLGELEEAVEVLERNLQVHPRSMPSFALLGDVYVRLEQYQKAKESLEQAVKMAPAYAVAYYGLANACARLGEKQKSKEYLGTFKALKQRDEQDHRDKLKTSDDLASARGRVALVHTAAAKVHLLYGDSEAAEANLLRAAELSPSVSESLTVLAWLYERQGRDDEAMEALLRADENDPEDVGVQMRLGALHARLRQFESAEKAFSRVTQISPHQAGGYAALANLYLSAGRKLPEAQTMALEAVDREPQARNYSLLSMAYWRNGDWSGARSAIERALAMEPGNPEYSQALQTIQQDGTR